MKTTYEITNQELFSKKVIDVDTSLLSCSDYHPHHKNYFVAKGNLEIEVVGEGKREYDGEHGAFDYEDDFGFILKKSAE